MTNTSVALKLPEQKFPSGIDKSTPVHLDPSPQALACATTCARNFIKAMREKSPTPDSLLLLAMQEACFGKKAPPHATEHRKLFLSLIKGNLHDDAKPTEGEKGHLKIVEKVVHPIPMRNTSMSRHSLAKTTVREYLATQGKMLIDRTPQEKAYTRSCLSFMAARQTRHFIFG